MQSIELPAITSMVPYKRNQVEEAISAVMEPWLREPSTELRSRIKRLLDSDRAFYLEPDSRNPEHTSLPFMVGTTNRSMAAMSGAWLRRKVDHPWDGGRHRLTMYFATLVDTEARKI